ncbi:MAG: cobalt ECF transporter T component CbiQ [Thermodesulfobacteriota bacterium]|nr:cobalt ECF transporter T component CbiQ [Thermodesulfobacteriota bacterium]
MTCERFASGKSILHSADPRVKILLAVGYSVVTVSLGSLEGQIFAMAGGLLLVIAARLSFKEVSHRLFVVNLFILMLWLILPWTTPGTGVTRLGPIIITAEGLGLSLSISLKCNAIILANLALLSTSTIFSLAHALAHLRVPSKMVQLIFFSWRYFHVINSEFNRMKQAIKVRGFEPRSNLHTYRTYAYLIGTLFIKSLERGERVYKAMLCRGFDGTFWLLSHFRLHRRDICLAGLTSVYLFLIIGVDWINLCR